MKSAIYELSIEHHRMSPKRHSFKNRHFMLFLDLSKLDELSKTLRWFNHNKLGLFNFKDSDFLYAGNETIQSKVTRYLQEQKCDIEIEKIFLLANPRHLGYVFNPLSIYFCFDKSMELKAVVCEVCNTFYERKAYLLTENDLTDSTFKAQFDKEFYISPFTKLDDQIIFEITKPAESLGVQVTTNRLSETILVASMQGKRRELTDGALIECMFKYPLSNFMVTFGIHAHALLLWFKGVPHLRKESNPQLQTKILRSMKERENI
ncbi:MAG: DUF1365 domain-containing protein [Cyanobacteria bacterium TGS_CYA1]|nr:DUF1365 domain-containing protein [Cyanobacteria bacterium TGS_CYA1]